MWWKLIPSQPKPAHLYSQCSSTRVYFSMILDVQLWISLDGKYLPCKVFPMSVEWLYQAQHCDLVGWDLVFGRDLAFLDYYHYKSLIFTAAFDINLEVSLQFSSTLFFFSHFNKQLIWICIVEFQAENTDVANHERCSIVPTICNFCKCYMCSNFRRRPWDYFLSYLKDHHHWMSITIPGRFMSLRWIAIILLPWRCLILYSDPIMQFSLICYRHFGHVHLVEYDVPYCYSGSFLPYVLPLDGLLPLVSRNLGMTIISREELDYESHRDLFSFKRGAMRKSRFERLWSRTFYYGTLKSLL